MIENKKKKHTLYVSSLRLLNGQIWPLVTAAYASIVDNFDLYYWVSFFREKCKVRGFHSRENLRFLRGGKELGG